MKFKTTRSVFLDALKSVQNVVPAKASAPVISRDQAKVHVMPT